VLAQRSPDERVMRITVVRVGGQKDLFLEPKMPAAVLRPLRAVQRERRVAVGDQ
jgi:hypothetical protein